MVPRKVLAWAEGDGKGVAVARKEKELRCGIVYTSTPNPFLWARLSHCWWLNSRPRFHGPGEKKFPLRQTQPFLSFSFKLDQKSWREENSFLLFYSQLWISFRPFPLFASGCLPKTLARNIHPRARVKIGAEGLKRRAKRE